MTPEQFEELKQYLAPVVELARWQLEWMRQQQAQQAPTAPPTQESANASSTEGSSAQ